MKKAFTNWREGAIHLNFPNGNHISTTWARSSYSDNYDLDYYDPLDIPKYRTDRINPIIESDTCEIMIDCGDKLLKSLEKKYNDGDSQPFARINIVNWLEIVDKVSKEKLS
jgi:hypothetical protein